MKRLTPFVAAAALAFAAGGLRAQGVTTAALNGIVTDTAGNPLADATVEAVHVPSGTRYRSMSRSGGAFTILNMRVGGPYLVTVTRIGYEPGRQPDVFLSLAQTLRLDFVLTPQPVTLAGLQVTAQEDEVLNADRTGAATFVSREEVLALPSVKRSTRDLTRLDPRSDGNFSFAGRNWLYNNVSLDGSYFNNPFGLDDPAPGGQTASEPVPYDAVEQVQVSVAPFDVRQGGFTGANINTVTRSGTNEFRGSVYTFFRNEALLGNKIEGARVIADPNLSFNQTGFSLGGPLMRDKLFFFINGEFERRDDPGANFVANRGGPPQFGESRVEAAIMDSIRDRMISEYDYDPGAYEGFVHRTNNDKLLIKLDWNIKEDHNLSLRYNYLNALRDLPPHPFVLSVANTGRGPNESSLPFQNSGYTINNELNSFALELNSRWIRFQNRFFASYNRFRDFREPFSEDFPTIEIGEGGVTYTTVGHEPFSIHNILDQDVWQFQNNLSYFTGNHTLTFGGNFELFSFFNSFNIFRHGVFFLPAFIPIGSTFSSLDEFFTATDPANPNQKDFRAMIGTGPFKGENIKVGQLGVYVQDEFLVTPQFNLTLGLRADIPMYFTTPIDNPFSRQLLALDENGNAETVDQSNLPDAKFLLSPRVGFNWDATGDRSTQIRGGSGVFTGRVPFVWVGNVISNPGANDNLYPAGPEIPTKKGSILQQSFDLNAMDPNFKWPQVWTTNVAIDQRLPWELLGTLEVIYGKDLNSIFMRNADVDVRSPGTNPIDGRPIYSGELNPDGGAGIYVIDNTSDGWHVNVTAQLRKFFDFGLNASLAYSYTEAKNQIQSTEIASVLWQTQPIQGNPNRPGLSPSQFGQRHRIVGSGTYSWRWSERFPTHIGVFFQVAEGNTFTTQRQGGNRYSYIYTGDVNGDGQGGNDLIYIPRNQGESGLVDRVDGAGNVIETADQQWAALDAFIGQDKYLSSHRGQIAERGGGVNPWYYNVDLRVLQDFAFGTPGRQHTLQLSIDILNFTNLLSSSWGVRKIATPAAVNPLSVVGYNADGSPQLNFNGASTTFVADPSLDSRWQMQIGLRYLFN